MLSQVQTDFCGEIVSQYDYYVVYYKYDYTDYTTGLERDYLIQLYCSDQQPVVEDGTFKFTECSYYEVTHNKYMLLDVVDAVDFTPVSSSDIIYTNAVEGYPQLCYTTSKLRNFDFVPVFVYLAVAIFALIVLARILFGRS